MQLRTLVLASTLLAGCATDPADGVATQEVTYNGIDYHGGVLLGKPNVYLIWYGNWSGNSATQILPDLVSHLGGSRYWGIMQTYTNSLGDRISNSVTLARQVTIGAPYGTSLGPGDVPDLVERELDNGALPVDVNGIYLVLTSPEISESSSLGSFCSPYLGYHASLVHTDLLLTKTNIKFGFIGDPALQCSDNAPPTSPNSNPGADEMASVIAHELAETVTDPLLTAWWRNPGPPNGNEVGDLCGSTTWQTLGTSHYWLQSLWINAFGGHCSSGVARVSVTTPYDAAYITSATPGLSCSSNCTTFFEPIASYTMTAHLSAGTTLTGWLGCTTYSGTTCTVTTSVDHDVKPLVCNRAGYDDCMANECVGPIQYCSQQCRAEWGC